MSDAPAPEIPSPPKLRPWRPDEVRFTWYRRRGVVGYEGTGVLHVTQVCDRGVALGPSRQLTSFEKLLAEWEYATQRNGTWLPCGEPL